MATGSSSNPSGSEEKRETVAQIAARLRLGEDFNLAYSLQDAEFRSHYSKNKDQRANMAKDGKMSREEQRAEWERAEMERAEKARQDEELAKELASRMEQEESQARLKQASLDAELARRLQAEFLHQLQQQRAD